MIDLLEMLNTNSISLDASYDLIDRTVENIHLRGTDPDWARTLGLSTYEARAYAHGAGLEDLVHFRYQGWPISCAYCNLHIDLERDHWWFRHDKKERPCLIHTHCLEGWNRHSLIG